MGTEADVDAEAEVLEGHERRAARGRALRPRQHHRQPGAHRAGHAAVEPPRVGGGVAAYVLSDRFPTVLAAANTAYLIYGTSITPAVLAAFLWRRATATGAVASIVTGTATTLIWKYSVDKTGFSPLLAEVAYPAAFCSIAALVLGSYATAAPPAEVWRKFCDDGEGLELKAAGGGGLFFPGFLFRGQLSAEQNQQKEKQKETKQHPIIKGSEQGILQM